MPTNSRRKALENIAFSAEVNAGLWLDKYFSSATENARGGQEEEPKQRHFHDITRIKYPADYKCFYERWENLINTITACSREIVIDGRMIVGLGNASVLENSISIHRTYGVPFIPGSALKGLAAHFAHKNLGEEWRDDAKYGNGNGTTGALHRLIFGSRDFAGFVVFYDALLCPESGNLPLHREIMTVHHQEYYQNGSAPPADWDSPVPIPFISASGKYLVAVGAPDGLKHLADKAIEILAEALKTEGIGAKTSSGYGRAFFVNTDIEAIVEQDESVIKNFRMKLDGIKPQEFPTRLADAAKEWREREMSPRARQLIAKMFVEKVIAAKKEDKLKDKAWFVEVSAAARKDDE